MGAIGRMKVLFWTLLVASFIYDEAKANAKTDCQNRVKATAGKLIQECQDEWNDKCARYDHNGNQEISKVEADKSLIRLMQKCQEKTEPKSIRAKRSKAKDECMRQVI